MFTNKIIDRIWKGLDSYEQVSSDEKENIISFYRAETISEIRWKKIPGFDGSYEISNFCAVRSWKSGQPKILKPSIGSHGYLVYGLHKNNRTTGNGLLHRFFANAFVPNSNNLPVVNHKNGVKLDNRPLNIEWCSFKENINHAFKNGLAVNKGKKGEEHPMAKLTWDEVKDIRQKFNSGEYSQVELSELYDISVSSIGSIVRNKSWYDEDYQLTDTARKSFKKSAVRLSDEEVLEIRNSYKEENITQEKLAERYGVEGARVSGIIRNEERYDSDYVVPVDKLKSRKRQVGRLVEEDVLEIRKRYKEESITQAELADSFSVDQGTISNIVNKRTWDHI